MPKKFSEEELNELAHDLVSQIEAYKADMGDRVDTWEKVLGVYNDDPEMVLTSMEWPKDVKRPYNVPLIQTRTDALVSDVIGSIVSAKPVFTNVARIKDVPAQDEMGQPMLDPMGMPVFISGEEIRESAERTLDFALRQCGFEKTVRDAGYDAVLRGRGCFRLRYITAGVENLDDVPETVTQDQSGYGLRYSGLHFDSVPIEDFICYPFSTEFIQEAQTVGHMFTQRIKAIEARIRRGEYLDIDLPLEGDVPETTAEPEDASKTCYELITRLQEDELEVWYKVTLLYEDQKILAIEPYPYTRPWYFAPGFRLEPNKFLPERSIAAKALELQALANDVTTAVVTGSLASALTSVLMTGATFDEQQIKLGFGEIVTSKSAPTSITPIGSQFNAQQLFSIMPQIEAWADQVFRIGAPAMGSYSQKETTATEQSIVAEGQARGYQEFKSTFAVEIEAMAEFARQLLAAYYEEFSAYCGSINPCKSEADIIIPGVWEVNSRSPNLAPEIMLNKIDRLMGLMGALGVMPNAEKIIELAANAMDLSVDVESLINNEPILDSPQEAVGGTEGGFNQTDSNPGPATIPGLNY